MTTTTRPATGPENSVYQQLRGHLATLKLTACAEALPGVLDEAQAEGLSMTATLERLLAIEVDATEARRLAGRLRFASLPTPAALADFDFDAQPGVDRALIAELGTCRYLETATNVLLIGPPGVGKTHLAVGLARQAAEVGYRTYFTTAADLAARCHRAAIEGRWAYTMRFFAGPTLLVIDELDYLPLPAEADSTERVTAGTKAFTTSILGLASSTDTTGVATSYTRDNLGNLIGTRTATGEKSYFIHDALGSIVGIIDHNHNQNRTATYTYDPYGNHIATGNAAPANPFRFAGGYHDAQTGLTKFGTRYYDSTIARWTQTDPAPGQLPYAYAGNNPINNVDPTGYFWEGALAVAGLALSVAGAVAAAPALAAGGTAAVVGLYGIAAASTVVSTVGLYCAYSNC